MAFIVQAKSLKGEASVTELTRVDAMKKAVELLGDGLTAVAIIENGRSYSVTEFAATFGKEDS